jgi:hypothetical protein
MYTQTTPTIVTRTDGIQIPADPENTDFRAFLAWCTAGNTPEPAPAAPPVVPAAVTQRQARRALLAAGKLATVNAAIAGMSGAEGEAARIDWEFAASIERASPLVAAMGAVLQMDGAALDALFRQAAAL